MLRVAIILGSMRPGRRGEPVAKWVYEVAKKRRDAEFELVDLIDFNLPHLDEPMPPSFGQYTQPHRGVGGEDRFFRRLRLRDTGI